MSLEHRTTGARPKSVCFVTFVVGIVRRPTVCYVLSAQSKVKPLARLWIFDCKIPFPPTTVCVFRVPRGWCQGWFESWVRSSHWKQSFYTWFGPFGVWKSCVWTKITNFELDILVDLLSLSSNMAYLVPLLAGWVLKRKAVDLLYPKSSILNHLQMLFRRVFEKKSACGGLQYNVMYALPSY